MFPITEINIEHTVDADKSKMGKSFLFNFSEGDFVIEDGKLIETDDLTVWIEKILRTEKGRYKIYEGTSYGIALEDLIVGTNYPLAFAENELRREIQETLIKHPQITGVTVRSITRQELGVLINVEVTTIDGTRNINTTI